MASRRPAAFIPRWQLWMYEARDESKEYFAAAPPRMIEYDDGIASFATRFPATSGLGFAIDPESVPWVRNGRILSFPQRPHC